MKRLLVVLRIKVKGDGGFSLLLYCGNLPLRGLKACAQGRRLSGLGRFRARFLFCFFSTLSSASCSVHEILGGKIIR